MRLKFIIICIIGAVICVLAILIRYSVLGIVKLAKWTVTSIRQRLFPEKYFVTHSGILTTSVEPYKAKYYESELINGDA